MRRALPMTMFVPVLLCACATHGDKETLASLRGVELRIEEQKISGSLDKAMESYRRFLAETPATAMTPEAIRRLADLKIEKEYGVITEPAAAPRAARRTAEEASPHGHGPLPAGAPVTRPARDPHEGPGVRAAGIAGLGGETAAQFEARSTQPAEHGGAAAEALVSLPGEDADLQVAGAQEAIGLYQKLLARYPLYERNDQVLYQLSRAYEETGQVDEAVAVLNRLVVEYPQSRHLDEAQFRRAEYFFVQKRYLDAEEAYQTILDIGVSSAFYELALYKQGWAFFKQEMYEEALTDFIGLLDYKIATGFDFENTPDKIEKKRIDDTYRVISLGFSYLGGPEAIVAYFDKHGVREYEASIYSHLGEHYLETRRYADAANAYNTYVERNPLNKVSPYYHMRVIDIYKAGGFPKLVVEAKRRFAATYGLAGTYWTFFEIGAYPDVLEFLKSNLVDLANHYHALYQNKDLQKFRRENYEEAARWYQSFLESFPEDGQAPSMNYQLADLLLEHKDYRAAALEYERASYGYAAHERSSAAGYAAVYCYREFVKQAPAPERAAVQREVVRVSLRFSENYPRHDKAAIVQVAAIDDLYELRDYGAAIAAGRRMLAVHPDAERELRRSAWLVIAHASFDLASYGDAEQAYSQVLALTEDGRKGRDDLIENLAASIYKQGEQARELADHRAAADHFLRVAAVTPTSKIRATAEYDAAASLISSAQWGRAADVLVKFRARYPKHELQPEVTKKLAVAYKADGRFLLAAAEFERIENEVEDHDLRREALLQAAELYEQERATERALAVYHRFVQSFTKPLEFAIETRQKIADIYRRNDDEQKYMEQLDAIIKADAAAGSERTDRTRYLAAKAALVVAEQSFEKFRALELVKPFKKNLDKKKQLMKDAIDTYTKLLDYEVGEVTAAAGYYIAEVYYAFSQSLMQSERPDRLNDLEREQYELALEEQAFPFEEKAIKLHQKNLELLDMAIYNPWIEKSLAKLARLLPARFAKAESYSGYATSFN